VLSLLGKARVVNNPRRYGLLLLKGIHSIASRLSSHFAIIPGAVAQKGQEPSLDPLALFLVCSSASRDGLDALALTIAYDSIGVQRKRLPLLTPPEMATDSHLEKFL
jgi:hypothetical protein